MPAGMEGFGSDAEVRDTSGEEWPFATGSVIGYRWWTYQVHRSYCPQARNEGNPCFCGLYPVLRGSFDGEWESSVLRAECGQSHCKRVLDHPEICGCGIWAYWRLPFSRKSSTGGYTYPVAGRIEGSGRVVIGEKGFRCERARITHLAVYQDTPETVVRALERTFELSGGLLVGRKDSKFGINPVNRVLARKTKADPQYGPPPMSARKIVRIITGF